MKRQERAANLIALPGTYPGSGSCSASQTLSGAAFKLIDGKQLQVQYFSKQPASSERNTRYTGENP
jgi:hypothetical protein